MPRRGGYDRQLAKQYHLDTCDRYGMASEYRAGPPAYFHRLVGRWTRTGLRSMPTGGFPRLSCAVFPTGLAARRNGFRNADRNRKCPLRWRLESAGPKRWSADLRTLPNDRQRSKVLSLLTQLLPAPMHLVSEQHARRLPSRDSPDQFVFRCKNVTPHNGKGSHDVGKA